MLLNKNASKLPPRDHFLTEKHSSTVKFLNTDILKIIQNLNSNKARGQDKISIWMLKICRNSFCRPLELVFNNCLTSGVFPFNW